MKRRSTSMHLLIIRNQIAASVSTGVRCLGAISVSAGARRSDVVASALSLITAVAGVIIMVLTISPAADATFFDSDAPIQLEHQLDGGEVDSLAIASDILEEALRSIQSLYIDSVSVEFLLEAAFAGIRERLDPHTKFLPPDEFGRLMSPITAKADIGVVCDFNNSFPRIKRLLPGAAAIEAGLRSGDRILEINGHSLNRVDSTQVYKWLRGPSGSSVNLVIESPGESVHQVEVSREVIGEPMLVSALIQNGTIGYLQIKRFSRGIAADCEKLLTKWSGKSLDGMIIDLRDNPGGFLDEAVYTADLWVPAGKTIVVAEGRAEGESSFEVSKRTPLMPDVPVVVLIDSLTASSAEIFAGALQAGAGAVLMGESSYGKRTVQRVKRLPGGGAIKVTSAIFRTPADTGAGTDGAGSRDLAAITGMASDRRILRPSAGRGARLTPGIYLAKKTLSAPWSWIYQSGLLARFEEEDTFPVGKKELADFWAPESRDKAKKITQTAENPAIAPGFEIWLDQLHRRLRTWGVVIEPMNSNDSAASQNLLRQFWFADWAAERWGDAAGQIAAISTNHWVKAASIQIYKQNHRRTESIVATWE